MKKLRLAVAAISTLLLISAMATAPVLGQPSDGIVDSVTTAPIVNTGTVAGAPTDIVINLDRSLDPAVPGRTLRAGDTIRITLPDDFVSQGLSTDLPTACNAFAGECNTGVLLQGWPQRPIPPTEEFYTLEMDGTHTFVFTAMQDLEPGATPGIKQVHLMALGFTNPPPAEYHILVEAQTGPDGEVETGIGQIVPGEGVGWNINPTSVFAKESAEEPNGNTIYQEARVGESPPWDWDLLVFAPNGSDPGEIALRPIDDSGGEILWRSALRMEMGIEEFDPFGTFTIEGPEGATGQTVSGDTSELVEAPVSGATAARLTAVFTAGDKPGTYVTTFAIDGAELQQMFVNATE